jgi:hypothetical protein
LVGAGVLVGTGVLVGCAGTLVLLGSTRWVGTGVLGRTGARVLVEAGACVLVGAGARTFVGTGARVLVEAETGVRVFVGGFGFDDEPPLVGTGVLVAAAKLVGCAAVAAGRDVLVALGTPVVGVARGVFVGLRVAVAVGGLVAVGVAVAALVAVGGGVSVGGVVGASGSRSPIA